LNLSDAINFMSSYWECSIQSSQHLKAVVLKWFKSFIPAPRYVVWDFIKLTITILLELRNLWTHPLETYRTEHNSDDYFAISL